MTAKLNFSFLAQRKREYQRTEQKIQEATRYKLILGKNENLNPSRGYKILGHKRVAFRCYISQTVSPPF